METARNRLIGIYDSLSMTSSQQDLQITSVYSQADPEDIKSDIVSVDSRPPPVKKKHEMKYMNLEKQQTLIKAGFLKGPYKPTQTTQQQSETERRTTKDECQQDFSSVLLPSFSKTRAHFFKQHLLNNQTELTKTVHTFKDSKGIRHNRKLSPILSNEIQMLMNQTQQTNLPWTTTKYSLNNTLTSAKLTIKDDKKSLGVFPSKMRSQSINPAHKTAILNNESNIYTDTRKQSQNIQLKLTQTLSHAFYKPKQSLDKYQDTFTKSYLQGFQTQKQIKIKETTQEIVVPPLVQVDLQSIPKQFHQTTIAGHRVKASEDLLPSCFCTAKYNEVCKRHTDWKPTIDNMLDLLESQVEDLQQDEHAIDQNLDMIGDTSEQLLTSRTDDFKIALATEYRKKEEEIDVLQTQVAHLNLHENQYRVIVEERDYYKQSLEQALQVISRFEQEVNARSEITKREISMLTVRDNSVQSELQQVKTKLEKIMTESDYLKAKVAQKDSQLQESQLLLEKLNVENNRMVRENETFRKYFVLNNAMLLEHKDNPAYIRQQIDEMYRDFGKATNNSGKFIHEGFSKIEKIINDAFTHKSDIMDKYIKQMKFDEEDEANCQD